MKIITAVLASLSLASVASAQPAPMASDASLPTCSATVTDNCMQRSEGASHAMVHHATTHHAKHHAKHRMTHRKSAHRVVHHKRHKRHHVAAHHVVPAKSAPAHPTPMAPKG